MSNLQTPTLPVIIMDSSDSYGRGVIFVFVGPAGVGKNTVIKRIMHDFPRLQRMPTATTRPPREGEREGIDHFFVSVERFSAMRDGGELLEYEEVHPGKFYGAVRRPVEESLARGDLLVSDIDVKGAVALKAAFPNHVVTFFILPPTEQALLDRMRERGEATEAEILQRHARAQYELSRATESDYRVVNDNVERCAAEVRAIVLHHAPNAGDAPYKTKEDNHD